MKKTSTALFGLLNLFVMSTAVANESAVFNADEQHVAKAEISSQPCSPTKCPNIPRPPISKTLKLKGPRESLRRQSACNAALSIYSKFGA